MTLELPPGRMGSGPHASSPVPRVDLDLTPAEVLALQPTIEKMRKVAKDNVGLAGFDCPCCKRLVHMYRPTLPVKAVQFLLLLYTEYGRTEHFHLRHDGQLLWGLTNLPVEIWLFPWWGLIEPYTLPETRERADGTVYEVDVEQSGEYFISTYADQWILGRHEIPSHCVTYNGNVLYLDTSQSMTIEQGVGHRFDLAHLESVDPDKRKDALLAGDLVKRPRRPKRGT